jgi:hypothetical protein
MNKPIKRSVVTLKEDARQACLSMLRELRTKDKSVRIDNSKLVSYILCEYFESFFHKNKEKIRNSFQDSKKKIISDINDLSPEKLEELSRFLIKRNFQKSNKTGA